MIVCTRQCHQVLGGKAKSAEPGDELIEVRSGWRDAIVSSRLASRLSVSPSQFHIPSWTSKLMITKLNKIYIFSFTHQHGGLIQILLVY